MAASTRFALRWLLPPMLLLAVALAVLLAGINLPLWLWLRGALWSWGAAQWSALTLAGDALVTPLLITPFLARRPRLALEGLCAALCSTVLVHLLKPLVQMPRPAAVLDGITVIGPRLLAGAFPSGHTASAFTLLGLLCLSGMLRAWLPWIGFALLALLVGLSRILVGAHWPADVLAGAAIGWLSGGLGILLLRRWPEPLVARLQIPTAGLLLPLALLDLLGHDTGYGQGLWLQHALAVLALASLAWQSWQAWRAATTGRGAGPGGPGRPDPDGAGPGGSAPGSDG